MRNNLISALLVSTALGTAAPVFADVKIGLVGGDHRRSLGSRAGDVQSL